MTDEQIRSQNARMRAMPDAERRVAIAAADNVIGFGRFRAASRRLDFATAYSVRLEPEPA